MHRALLWRTRGKSLFFHTRVGRLHYYDIPGSGPLGTVVMLHGASQGAVHYARVILPLTKTYSRIVAVDAPAHGLSAAPPSMDSDVLAAGVTELLDAVIGDHPAVVFGTSLGGAMALKYGLSSPERVSKLCLLSPAGAPLSEGEREGLMQMFAMERHRDSREFMRLVAHRPSLFANVIAVETRRRFRTGPMRQLFDSFASGESEFQPDEMRSLQPPVRLIWGRRERVLPPSNLRFFEEHLPVGRRVIVEPPHFAHAAFLEYPKEVAEHINLSGKHARRVLQRQRQVNHQLDPFLQDSDVLDIPSHRVSNRPVQQVSGANRVSQAGHR